MTRKKKCVECRHCETRLDTVNGTRHHCAKRRRVLPANVTSRPACAQFEVPRKTGHWGP